MNMSKCGCNNCMAMARSEGFMPCIKQIDPPKQEPLGEYKALKKMLEHFQQRNACQNESLSDFREWGRCTPLKTIDVQELKDYMIAVLEKGSGI